MLTGGEFSAAIGKKRQLRRGRSFPPPARCRVRFRRGATNLQALLDKRGSVIKSGDIALVVSNKAGCIRTSAGKKMRALKRFIFLKTGRTPHCSKRRRGNCSRSAKSMLSCLRAFCNTECGFYRKVTTGASSTFIRRSSRPSAERVLRSARARGCACIRREGHGCNGTLCQNAADGGEIIMQKAVMCFRTTPGNPAAARYGAGGMAVAAPCA